MVHLRLNFFLKTRKQDQNTPVYTQTRFGIRKVKETNNFYNQIKINKKPNKKHFFFKNLIIINNNTKELISF